MIVSWDERLKSASPLRKPALFASALLALFIFCSAAHADEPSALSGETLRLIVAKSDSDASPILAGVQMKLAPGWHTYWRKPGDSGLAPRFDWSKSENIASIDLLWPVPQRFDAPGDTTFGYEDEIVWPVIVRAADAAKPVTLRLTMTYGVCSEICVPGEAHLIWSSSADGTDEEDGAQIRRFLARVASAPRAADAVIARLVDESSPHLEVRLKKEGETPDLIVEGPRGVYFGKPEATRDGAAVKYVVPVEMDSGVALKGAEVTLTFTGAATAIEASRKVE